MRRILVLAVVASVAAAAGAGSASAATGFESVGSFAGTLGSGDGEVFAPRRVAVGGSSGNVFLVDQGNDRVQVFAPDGSGASYLAQFGVGVVDDPLGVAVDQGSGSVFVSDGDDVVKFDSDGQPTPTFVQDVGFSSPGVTGPIAFDQAGDQLLVADVAANVVRRYSAGGALVSSFDGSTSPGGGFAALKDLAVQDDGDVLVVDGERVVRFADDDSYQGTFSGLPDTPTTIAAVPGTDESVIAHQDALGYDPATFGAVGGELYRFAGDSYNGSFGFSQTRVIQAGLAVAPGATPRLYASTDWLFDYFGIPGVEVFDGFEIQPATIADTNATPSTFGARLTAKINPNKDQTSWTFEYGETTSYGSQLPIEPAMIRAGSDPVSVVRNLGGLKAGTTYHWRVVATNGAGTAHSPDQTFTTKPNTPPGPPANPDGRAYEQVSPVDKNGQSVTHLWTVQSTADANAIAYSSFGAFPGAETTVLGGYYIGRRTNNGWTTDPIDAPQLNRDVETTTTSLHLADDLSATVQLSQAVLTSGASGSFGNIYRRDNLTGQRTLMAADTVGSLTGGLMSDLAIGGLRNPIAGAADARTFAFSTNSALIPDAAPGVFNTYQYIDGELELVNRLPDGTVPSGGGILANRTRRGANLMSDDGRRVLFTVPGFFGGPVYMRIDGTTTKLISGSKRGGDDPTVPVDAAIEGASSDLGTVWLTSMAYLTDDAAGIPGTEGLLYRYDVASDSLTFESGDDLDGDVHSALVATVSDDGSTAYFQMTRNGERELRVSRDGTVKDVAPDSGGSSFAMSPDGRYFAFVSSKPLTGFDNASSACADAQSPNCDEIFVYDADEDELRCATCVASGFQNRDSTFGAVGGSVEISGRFRRMATDDGRVFFTSDEALVPQDVNGKKDAYQWNDGELSLISSGKGTTDSRIAEVSPNGESAFFYTNERLVAQDLDNQTDVYVARVGGGIASQNLVPTGERCDGDDCQGRQSARPSRPSPRTGGEGFEPSVTPRAVFSLRRMSGAQQARLAAGRSATLRVRVNRAGRVRVTARAKLGKRTRTVADASRRIKQAGIVKVPVRLSRAARARLAQGMRLKVTLAIRFTGSPQPRRMTLDLRRPR